VTDTRRPNDPGVTADDVDIERLAAMLEGTVSDEERRALMAKLGTSDSAVSAFADAALIHAAETNNVRPISMWARNQTWIGLAASVALVVGIGSVLMRGESDNLTRIDQLVRMGSLTASLNPYDLWDATRGANIPDRAIARGIRFGALLFDLHARVLNSDSTATDAALRLGSFLSEIPGAGSIASEFRRLGEASVSLPALARPTANAEQLLGADPIRAGAWLQAARHAAQRRDADFFKAQDIRAALDYLGSVAVDPTARSIVGDLNNQASSTAPSWDKLATDLSRLLGELGR
jgi:hypothetical protein